MVRHIEAVFSGGAFRPVEAVSLPEGTRVRLSVEEGADAVSVGRTARIYSPKLVHPEDAKDFVMEVREAGNAVV
jgi:predicted DNA-binding antitoxin AbrB/MazE fold protein